MGATTLDGDFAREELMEALRQQRIHARYQPIVRMSDRHPTGFEVLARLDHPVRGMLEADSFVPAMEAAGLGRALSEAVVERAFAEWRALGLADLPMTLSINLPLDVLLMEETAGWIEAARQRNAIPADRIIIELTESQDFDSLEALGLAIARLRARGFRLAIDDVGPTIRDHRPLLDLPFSLMKLDRSLVQGGDEDTERLAFLDLSLQAARDVGLAVVAEGVEDAETWGRMSRAGIDQAQGYFIAQPMQAGDIAAWRARWSGMA